MIRHVLIDLDDTILDFHRSEAEALSEALRGMNIEPTDGVIKRYSEINDAQWKLLELGKLTRTEVKRRRFALLFEWLGLPQPLQPETEAVLITILSDLQQNLFLHRKQSKSEIVEEVRLSLPQDFGP